MGTAEGVEDLTGGNVNTPQNTETDDESTTSLVDTEAMHTPRPSASLTNSEFSSEPPRKFKSISDIYARTEETELEEEELFLMGINEPTSYGEAVKEQN